MTKFLGKGAFGSVWKGTKGSIPVAVKVLKVKNEAALCSCLDEIGLLNSLQVTAWQYEVKNCSTRTSSGVWDLREMVLQL